MTVEAATQIIDKDPETRAAEGSWFRCNDKRKGDMIQLSFCPNTCSLSKMNRCKLRLEEIENRGW